MNVSITKKDSSVVVSIEGSVNTQTAPQLDEEIKASLEGAKEIILDFSKVDYISSAGLRLILVYQNQMDACGGKMVVKDAIDEVKEIFDMTGFSSIINFV
ncbi:MAG: STAS domain-containing protein [Fibrobacter sp.]|nr:STAS domain-containing protein [Fibrobacter sp.]